jgi:hypothetical protein
MATSDASAEGGKIMKGQQTSTRHLRLRLSTWAKIIAATSLITLSGGSTNAQATDSCVGTVSQLSPRISDGGLDVIVGSTSCTCTSTGGPGEFAFTMLGNNGNRTMSYANALAALLANKTVRIDFAPAGSSPNTAYCVLDRVLIYR